MIQPALRMRRRHRRLVLGVATRLMLFASVGMCVSMLPGVAHAQEGTDPKREAEYQELINYALEEYERGSWEESAALFNRAHELIPSARTLRGLGLATYEARRYAESCRHLRAALADKRRPLTDKQREEVQHTLDRAKLFVGLIVVDLTPADAQLTINGRVLDPEPDTENTFMVDTGFIDLEANAQGYLPASRRMRIGGGEQQRVVMRLASSAPAPEAHVERAPVLSEPAPVAVAPSRPHSAESSSLGTWKWVAGAGAVVALGVGGTMLAMQKAQAPAYERECNQSPTPAADCDARHTYLSSTLWIGSISGLALGGALTALSVTLFVMDANAKDESQSGLSLICGGGPLGVSCQGKF